MKYCLNSLGLHIYGARDRVSDFCLKSVNNNLQTCSLLQTVNTSTSQFSVVESKRENEAKFLTKQIGGMPFRKSSSNISNNSIRNTTLSSVDDRRASETRGTGVGNLEVHQPKAKQRAPPLK